MEFFYFCLEDEHFLEKCDAKTDFEIFEFLILKYDEYTKNINEVKD